MAERVQVSDLRARPQITPAAKPVDTYYRPVANTVAQEGPSEFEQLLGAFNEAAPAIKQALDTEFKRQAEKELKEGAAARLKNQKAFKQAVQEGLIPEGASPWFVKGYMQQEGRLDGMQYDAALRTAWAESPVKNKGPEELAAFMNEFRAKWLAERPELAQNLDFMDGFGPQVNQAETNLTAQHISNQQQEISAKVRDNTFREITGLVHNFQEAAQDAGDPTVVAARKAELGAQITQRLRDLTANGLPGREVNSITIEALATIALESRDVSVMDIAEHIETRDGAKLSGTGPFRQKRLQVEQHLISLKREDTRWQWSTEDRPYMVEAHKWAVETHDYERKERERRQKEITREEKARDLMSDLYVGLLARKPIDDSKVKALMDLNPTAGQSFLHFRKWYTDSQNDIVVDKKAVARMLATIARDPDAVNPDFIFNGVISGKWDLPQATHAYSMWKEALRVNTYYQQDPTLKEMRDKLGAVVLKDPEGIYGGGSLDEVAAWADFDAAVAEIMQDNSIPRSRKRLEIRKRMYEIAKEYNDLAVQQSQAAQKLGVTPKVDINTQQKQQPKKKSESFFGHVEKQRDEILGRQPKPEPTPASIEKLKNDPNPDNRRLFDEAYGPGAADKVLGAK